MKRIIVVCVLGLFVFTGCSTFKTKKAEKKASIPVQISKELDFGGSFYSYSDFSDIISFLDVYAERLGNNIIESNLEEKEKNIALTVIKSFQYALLKAGINGQVGTGSSSIKLNVAADNPITTRNILFDCYGYRDRLPNLWKTTGYENRDLVPAIKDIPANALFATEFTFYPEFLFEYVKDILYTLAPEYNSPKEALIRPLVNALSGNWAILILPNEDPNSEMFPFHIIMVIPDKNEYAYSMLATLAPMINCQLSDDCIKLTKTIENDFFKSIQPMLYSSPEDDLMVLYSSPQAFDAFIAQTPSLGDTKAFDELMNQMPTKGTSFLYSSEKLADYINYYLKTFSDIDIPVSAPRQLLVKEIKPNGNLVTLNSSWDINKYMFAFHLAPFSLSALSTIRNVQNNFKTIESSHNPILDVQLCRKQMQTIYAGLSAYANANKGLFPNKKDIEGLQELLIGGFLEPKDLICPSVNFSGGDEIAEDANSFDYINCSYVYFAGSMKESNPKLPLAFDWPNNHPETINVLYVDGTIESLTSKDSKLNQCRKIVGLLHGKFHYTESDFNRLIETATKFDKMFIVD